MKYVLSSTDANVIQCNSVAWFPRQILVIFINEREREREIEKEREI